MTSWASFWSFSHNHTWHEWKFPSGFPGWKELRQGQRKRKRCPPDESTRVCDSFVPWNHPRFDTYLLLKYTHESWWTCRAKWKIWWPTKNRWHIQIRVNVFFSILLEATLFFGGMPPLWNAVGLHQTSSLENTPARNGTIVPPLGLYSRCEQSGAEGWSAITPLKK